MNPIDVQKLYFQRLNQFWGQIITNHRTAKYPTSIIKAEK